MKNIALINLFILLSIFTFAQSNYIVESQQKLKNATAYTLEIAELMPEEYYDFKPVAEEMSFKEQLLHITGNANWLTSSYLGGKALTQDLRKKDYTKAEVIAIMKEGFANAAEALANIKSEQLEEPVKFFAGDMNKRQIMTLLNDHHTHHRGQIIVYLRLKGIKPPQYKGW
ncbi:MAG: DinB family protein [Saprospiraceae bacterium]|nr:DinB family protein [Saprospiraceae bacterium]